MKTNSSKNEIQETFWKNLTDIKNKKAPAVTWKDICAECSINYQTFRGAKTRGGVLQDSAIAQLALYFSVPQTYFFQTLRATHRTARRDRVCEEIYKLTDDQFALVERMLGLS